MFKKFLFYLRWFYQYKIKNEKTPLNSSIILTDECNLHCAHCSVAHLGYEPQTYSGAISDITKLYSTGSRMLVITGGEPFLWRDGEYVLDHVISFARELGFFRIVVCTNGTFELESKADFLWVSLDGEQDKHNVVRGDIHEDVLKNILKSKHKGIFINFTLSSLNLEGFEKAAEKIFEIKNVRGIFFHLFTPYLGSDKGLILSEEERGVAMRALKKIKLKYPLKTVNTFDGLKLLENKQWKRPIWSSMTINQGALGFCCCRKGIYDENVCAQCGCSPAVESYVLQELKPVAILENLRFL